MNQITKTICDQIGSSAFYMMGAKNLMSSDDGSLSFKIRGSKKANYIKVKLDQAKDLYEITFIKIAGIDIKSEKTIDNVYTEMMKGLIESETGLYLSL